MFSMAKFIRPAMSGGDDRKEQMQRVRVGLTGLAVVLLIVALATALFSRVGVEANSASAAQPQVTDRDEPLAHLGVAPGAANAAAPAK
jgi:hypothetical protein